MFVGTHRMTALLATMFLIGISQVRAENWVIDPKRTTIAFEVPSAMWGETKGVFGSFEGAISISFERPEKSSVSFSVDAASLTTGSPDVDDFVRSSALLDAAQFPKLTFTAQSIQVIDDSTVEVGGPLTMRGRTHQERFRVQVDRSRKGVVGLVASGELFRSRYGMDAGTPMVSNIVAITVKTAAVRR
jgi:polyisoprenoid-binding protein YceI